MKAINKIPFILQYIGFFCFLFFFEFATGFIRSHSVKLDLVFMFIKYALLTWFLISKRKMNVNKALLIPIFFLALVIPGLAYIIDGYVSIFTLPNQLFGLLGCLYGYLIGKRITTEIKILIPVVILLISFWYTFGNGFDHWCQILNGDTFTGKTKAAYVELGWKLYNRKNDTFTKENYKGKIVYLDFWSTGCGVCFQKFPELEKLYLQYKNRENVVIQAVNIPIERDTTGMAFYMIERSNKYTFPVVIGTDSMRIAFGVEAYPTVIILKDNKMVFRGRTELAKTALEDIIAGK
jgi:thiol-disulfide isomerase/thioredoxin